MPDEKQTRAIGPVRKWIGHSLSLLMLIGAIYLQVPWKFLGLLLVAFLPSILLPKSAQKWCQRGAIAIIIVLVIWFFLPDNNEGWRPYTFDKELSAIEAKRAIPDSENAAVIYNQLPVDVNKPSEPNLAGMQETLCEPWSSNDYPEIAQWLKNKESTITILLQASRKENCRFPLDADIMNNDRQTERLSALRRGSRLLIRAANNDLAENRTEAAMDKYFCCLRIANHIHQQPTILDSCTSMSIESFSANQLNKFIVTGAPTEEHLIAIEEALAEINYYWHHDLVNSLDNEKLCIKNLFARGLYEINRKGDIRYSRRPFKELLEANKTQTGQSYGQKKSRKAAAIFCWFFFPSHPETLSQTVDSIYEKYYRIAEPDFNWEKDPNEFSFKFKYRLNPRILIELTTGIMGGSYCKMHDIYLRHTADQKGNHLIIGLRRYKNQTGQWPERLDEIKDLAPAEVFVDPLNNGSFVYKLTEENFTLYSRGKNNTDENGRHERGTDEKPGPDDWLIWPKPIYKAG